MQLQRALVHSVEQGEKVYLVVILPAREVKLTHQVRLEV